MSRMKSFEKEEKWWLSISTTRKDVFNLSSAKKGRERKGSYISPLHPLRSVIISPGHSTRKVSSTFSVSFLPHHHHALLYPRSISMTEGLPINLIQVHIHFSFFFVLVIHFQSQLFILVCEYTRTPFSYPAKTETSRHCCPLFKWTARDCSPVSSWGKGTFYTKMMWSLSLATNEWMSIFILFFLSLHFFLSNVIAWRHTRRRTNEVPFFLLSFENETGSTGLNYILDSFSTREKTRLITKQIQLQFFKSNYSASIHSYLMRCEKERRGRTQNEWTLQSSYSHGRIWKRDRKRKR